MALTDYERYQLEWMIDHGHGLGELMGELTAWQNELEEAPGVNLSVNDAFGTWMDDRGFGGEIFASEAEWRDTEGRENDMDEAAAVAVWKQKNVLIDRNGDDALVMRKMDDGSREFVVAHAYDEETGHWGHGTYYGSIADAAADLEGRSIASHEMHDTLIDIALNARALDEALESGDTAYILDCATLAADAHIDIAKIAEEEGWKPELDRRMDKEFGTITKDMVREGIEHGVIRFEANPDPNDPWKTMCCVGENGGLFYFADTTDIPVAEYIRMNQNNLDMVVDDVYEALNGDIRRDFADDYHRYASILSEPHHGGTSSLSMPEHGRLQAVGVGYSFNLFDDAQLDDWRIGLKETGTVVTVDGQDYPLMTGATYRDSRLVDSLLDFHGEKFVSDYRKPQQAVSLKDAASQVRRASEALTDRGDGNHDDHGRIQPEH